MSAKKVRIQHYVSQFYLKWFAHIDGKKALINCFDKQSLKHFYTDITNIACEKYFYDAKKEDFQTVETSLAKIESRFNAAVSTLIKLRDAQKLSDEERYAIALFIATQYVRTKEFRETIKDMVDQTAVRLSGLKKSPQLEKEIKDAQTNESIKKMHIDLLDQAPELAEIICQMKWIILVNKTKTPFWTSDNPIVLHNEIDHSPRGNLGLTCQGIEIHIPLTPNLLLIACDPVSFSHEPDKKIVKDFRHIIREQSYQVYSSTRFIFSNKPDFSFAKKVVEENPRHKDPNRKRVSVK